MKLEEFRAILDQIAPYAYYLELYNWGEAFLHPDILEMIRSAAERRIIVSISSNLNALTPALAEGVVSAGLTKLLVSVDGASQESYGRYRRQGDLATVMENLRLLAEAKRRLGSSTPFITVRMLVHKHNEGEISELRQMVRQLGVDSFTTGPIFVDPGKADQAAEWLPKDQSLSCYDYDAKAITNVWHCDDLWEGSVINWDGGVAPCCWPEDPASDLANVLKTPFDRIWNGDAYVSARRVIGRHAAEPGDAVTICHACRGHPRYLEI